MYSHAVVYLGAPYGDNESGHIISRHRSRDAAESALFRHTHVRQCWDGKYQWTPTTATLDCCIVELVDGKLPPRDYA